MKKYFILLVSTALISSCEYKKGQAPKPIEVVVAGACDSVKYSVDIQPILNTYCTGCHSASPDFTNYVGTKLKVDDGTFKNRVITLKDMPLDGPLSQANLDKIQCWLDKGAPNN